MYRRQLTAEYQRFCRVEIQLWRCVRKFLYFSQVRKLGRICHVAFRLGLQLYTRKEIFYYYFIYIYIIRDREKKRYWVELEFLFAFLNNISGFCWYIFSFYFIFFWRNQRPTERKEKRKKERRVGRGRGEQESGRKECDYTYVLGICFRRK